MKNNILSILPLFFWPHRNDLTIYQIMLIHAMFPLIMNCKTLNKTQYLDIKQNYFKLPKICKIKIVDFQVSVISCDLQL